MMGAEDLCDVVVELECWLLLAMPNVLLVDLLLDVPAVATLRKDRFVSIRWLYPCRGFASVLLFEMGEKTRTMLPLAPTTRRMVCALETVAAGFVMFDGEKR